MLNEHFSVLFSHTKKLRILEYMLVVRKSGIDEAGKGLFTTSRIRRGDTIVEYLGEKMTWKQCLKKYKNNAHELVYVFSVTDENCIDAHAAPDALARFANDANGTEFGKRHKNNSEYRIIKKRPYIVATREIKAGTEILVDYGDEYWDAIRENMMDTEKEKVKRKKKKAGTGKEK